MGDWRKSSHSTCNGQCVEVRDLDWRKSTRSVPNGECVEACTVPSGGVAVRDSKLGPASPVLPFTADAWREFTAECRQL